MLGKRMQKIIDILPKVLTPDLLQKKYSLEWSEENPMSGFCYVCSEVLQYFLKKYQKNST